MKAANLLIGAVLATAMLLGTGCKEEAAPGPGGSEANVAFVMRDLTSAPPGGRLQAAQDLAKFTPEQLKDHLPALRDARSRETDPTIRGLIEGAIAKVEATAGQ